MKAVKLVLTVLLLLLAACRGDRPAGEDPAAQVSVEGFQYTRAVGGARFVSGRLINPTAEPIRNAQIQISLFDADNRLVSSMSVVVQDILPGQQKAFSHPVDADERVQRARVRGVLVM